MTEGNKKHTRSDLRGKAMGIIFAGCFGVLYWILASFMDLILFRTSDITRQLLYPGMDQAVSRIVVIFILFIFSFCINYSISRRKRLLDAGRSGESEYKALFEESQDAIYIRSHEGFFTDVNQSMLDLFGYTREEMMGMDIRRLYVSDEDRLAFEEEIAKKESVRNFPESLRAKDGSVLDCLVSSSLWRDENGKITGYQGVIRDITEIKRAERALRESEERYREMTDNANDIIFTHDFEERFTSVNKKVAEVTGYTLEECLALNVSQVVAPEYLELSRVMVELKLAGETQTVYEVEIITKDGRRLPMEVSSRLIWENGKPAGVHGIARDITDRKNIENALRESEAKFRALVDSTASAIFIIQGENVLYVNPAFEKLTGYTLEEFEGRSFQDFLHPDSRQITRERARARQSGQQAPTRYEFKYITKDGRERWADFSASLIDYGGQPAMLGSAFDITERRLAENELAAERERLTVTLRSIGDGVITTDIEGRIVLINNVAEGLTGWTQEEAAGKPLQEVFHIINEKGRELCENPLEKVMRTGGVVRLVNHTLLVARDGVERVIADSGAPIRDRESRIIGMVLVFRDITQARREREEHLKYQKLESIGVLAGGIAHDFNNILTIITGNIALGRTIPGHGEEMLGILSELEKAADRAKDLTYQLLTFSRGGAPIKKTASIPDLLRDTSVFALSGSNVKCRFRIDDPLWPADMDEGQISQVINNLIINARQAMPGGGVVEVIAENTEAEAADDLPVQEGQFLRISVTDRGVGIPRANLPKIFDPYFTTKEMGTGLGLAIAYSIARRHEGYLTVESEEGEGSTFRLYLPAAAAKTPWKEQEENVAVRGEGRVLLMDDDENVRKISGDLIKHLGYQVVTARDGAEAVAMYRAGLGTDRPFNAVLMDLTIPGGMGGKECVRLLREIDPDVKAIVSSGYSNDPIMSGYREYGFLGVIAKPYRMEELSRVLQSVIPGKKE